MKTLRTLRISVRGLFAHRIKATLALASIAGGVAAVIVTGAIGTGAKERVMRETEAMGTNLLVVRPNEVTTSAARSEYQGVVTTLTLDDYRAVAQLPSIAAAVPGFENSETVKAGDTAVSAMILGTMSRYLDVCRFSLRFGRFLTDDDNLASLRVAVLGARINEMLFGEQNSVGQQILIRGIPFEVVGVLNAKGVLADGSDEDDRVRPEDRWQVHGNPHAAAVVKKKKCARQRHEKHEDRDHAKGDSRRKSPRRRWLPPPALAIIAIVTVIAAVRRR